MSAQAFLARLTQSGLGLVLLCACTLLTAGEPAPAITPVPAVPPATPAAPAAPAADHPPTPPHPAATVEAAEGDEHIPTAAETLELERREALLAGPLPTYGMIAPFAILLGLIAVLPLIHKAAHTWEKNSVKLTAALLCAVPIVVYYGFMHSFPVELDHVLLHGTPAEIQAEGARLGLKAGKSGKINEEEIAEARLMSLTDAEIQKLHDDHAGTGRSLGRLFHHAVLADYIPFIVLLFSLYVIAGGIQLTGDIPAHPLTNTIFLAVGAVIASFIGTTGAAMLLIRPLLATNKEREHVKHTVIFFIFIVCNCGGLLTPLGDPPLFMGFLRGVPFFWTMNLWLEWLLVNGLLLITYYIWDHRMYKKEPELDIAMDETQIQPLGLRGGLNFLLLGGVVFAVATINDTTPFLGTGFQPFTYLREMIMLACAGLSYFVFTPKGVREAVNFNFNGILEVAALFIGIFLTMQIPVEILQRTGSELGLTSPRAFFWGSGLLSSFLDNAPTYIVFFSTAKGMAAEEIAKDPSVLRHMVALIGGGHIDLKLLMGISLGSVFMGANTYIGNGPNFLVKSVAEGEGVKMPSFFGYMGYAICILIPIFLLLTVLLPFLISMQMP